jgi:cytochrome c553
MRRVLSLLPMVSVAALVTAVIVAADGPPRWAYGTDPNAPLPGQAPAGRGAGGGGGGAAQPPDPTVFHLEGTTAAFTSAQIRDGFNPADWYPQDHPTPPNIVLHGRPPDLRACGLCHYPNGKGRPENAGISGLPTAYFLQQLMDFRADTRKSADPRKNNTNIMATIAKQLTEAEMKETAEYFGSMKWTPWVKVQEATTVPKTRVAGGLFFPETGANAGTEPIGMRIIEVPENPERTENLRDPRSGFIAYVPVGSIKKGEELVMRGGGRTTACGVCHGAELKGLGPVPPLAGRSPSYMVRMMYDMQQGARRGLWSELMKPVVEKLTEEDMLNIAAYTASRTP